MALEIVWTKEAEEGLDEIIEYLESNWADKEIGNFFNRLEDCLVEIRQTPNGPKDSSRQKGMKEYQHSKQTTIFYTFDNDNVYLMKIWANKKNPKNLK